MPVKLQPPSSDDHEEARIEIIPLIDIMFFLLASLMMVSLSMTQIHRVNLSLPSSTSATPDAHTPPIHLAIDAHGIITWDTQVVTPSDITKRLLALPPTQDTKILIAADKDSRHQYILALIDAAHAAGVEKISFETKAPHP